MSKKLSAFVCSLVCIFLIAGLAHQYKLSLSYQSKLGAIYELNLEHFTLDIAKWDKYLLDNKEQFKKDDIISMRSEAKECAYFCATLPASLRFINIYFIDIDNNLSILSNENSDSIVQDKQLLISDVKNNINILKEIFKTINDACGKNELKYYRELTNVNSNLNNKIKANFFNKIS